MSDNSTLNSYKNRDGLPCATEETKTNPFSLQNEF